MSKNPDFTDEVKSLIEGFNSKNADLKSEIEKQQEKLSAEIEKRITQLNAKAEDGQKATDDIKGELKNLVAKYNKFEEANQKHLDALDIKLKKITVPQGGINFSEKLSNVLKQHQDKIKAIGRRESKSFSISAGEVDFSLKVVGDMTGAANLTGDVARQQRLPGIIYDPERPTHIREFIATGVTGADTIRFIKETDLEGGVDVRNGQGVAYEQSDVDLDEMTSTRKSIGTYLRVSREMLEDVDGLASYLTTRFGKLLRVKEDQQILYGTGLSGQLLGLTQHSDVQGWTDTLADPKINRFDVLAAAVTQAAVSYYTANYALIHPNDAMKIRLTKDADGRYLFPSYSGGPLKIGSAMVVETTAISEGDFIVGDFALASQLFDRRQPEILFSTENADDFVKDFVTIKINEAVIFPIYRPTAYVYDTFAAALAKGSA